jgi:hypothetical protein
VQKYNPGSQKKGEVKGNDKKKGFNNRKLGVGTKFGSVSLLTWKVGDWK